jgi:hypothetical protein
MSHDDLCADIARRMATACACNVITLVRDNQRARRPHEPSLVLELDRWHCRNCEKPWPCPTARGTDA